MPKISKQELAREIANDLKDDLEAERRWMLRKFRSHRAGALPRVEISWCMSVKNPKLAHLCMCRQRKAAALCGNSPGKWRLSYQVGYCAECLDIAAKIQNFPLPATLKNNEPSRTI